MTAPYDLRRVRRLLLLLTAAARAAVKGRGVPLSRAVELTGARSEKEVREDVAALDALYVDPSLGEEVIDLQVEDGEVWLTYPRKFGSPPAFSLAEGAALLSALGAFEEGGPPALRSAVRKLRRAIPEPLRPDAERLARGLDLAPTPAGPWAGALREAIEKRLEAAIEYRAVQDGTTSRRVVEPRMLFHCEGRWYLAAWSVAKEAEHLFRLDRLVSVEVGTRTFGEHKGPSVARYARERLYFESGAEREVTVRFIGRAARLARERYGERAREGGDGSVTVAMKVTPGNYLFGVVLGYGGEASVVGPGEARDAFLARARELAKLYG